MAHGQCPVLTPEAVIAQGNTRPVGHTAHAWAPDDDDDDRPVRAGGSGALPRRTATLGGAAPGRRAGYPLPRPAPRTHRGDLRCAHHRGHRPGGVVGAGGHQGSQHRHARHRLVQGPTTSTARCSRTDDPSGQKHHAGCRDQPPPTSAPRQHPRRLPAAPTATGWGSRLQEHRMSLLVAAGEEISLGFSTGWPAMSSQSWTMLLKRDSACRHVCR